MTFVFDGWFLMEALVLLLIGASMAGAVFANLRTGQSP